MSDPKQAAILINGVRCCQVTEATAARLRRYTDIADRILFGNDSSRNQSSPFFFPFSGDRPPVRVNRLYVPSGAQRFSAGVFLVTTSQLAAIAAAQGSGGGGGSGSLLNATLFMGDGSALDGNSETGFFIYSYMFGLPPIPLGIEEDWSSLVNNNLMRMGYSSSTTLDRGETAYLLILVDQRYFWKFDAGAVANPAYLIRQHTGSSGATDGKYPVSEGDIAAYLGGNYRLDEYEDLKMFNWCRLIGAQLNYNSDYLFESVDPYLSFQRLAADRAKFNPVLFSGSPIPADYLYDAVPRTIRVLFPKRYGNSLKPSGGFYSVDVSLNNMGLAYPLGSGFSATMMMKSWFMASYDSVNSLSPRNAAELAAFAKTLACFYWNLKLSDANEKFAGICRIQPNALIDYILYEASGEDGAAFTSIRSHQPDSFVLGLGGGAAEIESETTKRLVNVCVEYDTVPGYSGPVTVVTRITNEFQDEILAPGAGLGAKACVVAVDDCCLDDCIKVAGCDPCYCRRIRLILTGSGDCFCIHKEVVAVYDSTENTWIAAGIDVLGCGGSQLLTIVIYWDGSAWKYTAEWGSSYEEGTVTSDCELDGSVFTFTADGELCPVGGGGGGSIDTDCCPSDNLSATLLFTLYIWGGGSTNLVFNGTYWGGGLDVTIDGNPSSAEIWFYCGAGDQWGMLVQWEYNDGSNSGYFYAHLDTFDCAVPEFNFDLSATDPTNFGIVTDAGGGTGGTITVEIDSNIECSGPGDGGGGGGGGTIDPAPAACSPCGGGAMPATFCVAVAGVAGNDCCGWINRIHQLNYVNASDYQSYYLGPDCSGYSSLQWKCLWYCTDTYSSTNPGANCWECTASPGPFVNKVCHQVFLGYSDSDLAGAHPAGWYLVFTNVDGRGGGSSSQGGAAIYFCSSFSCYGASVFTLLADCNECTGLPSSLTVNTGPCGNYGCGGNNTGGGGGGGGGGDCECTGSSSPLPNSMGVVLLAMSASCACLDGISLNVTRPDNATSIWTGSVSACSGTLDVEIHCQSGFSGINVFKAYISGVCTGNSDGFFYACNSPWVESINVTGCCTGTIQFYVDNGL